MNRPDHVFEIKHNIGLVLPHGEPKGIVALVTVNGEDIHLHATRAALVSLYHKLAKVLDGAPPAAQPKSAQ